MQRIIIDTDPGVDDTMAILLAFQSPELHVEALTTVFGNTDVETTTSNALRIVELVGRPDVPVARGAGKPLLRPFTGEGWRVHGRNGFGGVEFPPPRQQADRRHAAQLIIDMVLAHPGEIMLVPLGPLTNIALAVLLEPRIVQQAAGVVLMGGTATVPGNVSPIAEANVHNDPEAAQIVFSAGWPIVMVGLDVTTKTMMSQAYQDELHSANNRCTDCIYAISRHYNQFHIDQGMDGFYVHDSSAIAYLIDPTLFTTQPAHVAVEYHSPLHAGQTVADWRGRRGPLTTQVCVDVDSERFLALYQQRLREGV